MFRLSGSSISTGSAVPLFQPFIACSIAALLLAGCGGGSDSGADAGAAAQSQSGAAAQAAPADSGNSSSSGGAAVQQPETAPLASSAASEDEAATADAALARPRAPGSTATTTTSTTTATAPAASTTATASTASTALPASLTCGLPNFQAEIMRLMNEARASSRYCGSTLYPAAAPLKWNALLFNAAGGHSSDMAGKNYFSHTSLDGRTFSQRITAAGYAWRTAGENIAAGQTSIQSVMNGWLQSPGHCANIMKASYTEAAVSCAQNSASTYKLYWTMELAAPR